MTTKRKAPKRKATQKSQPAKIVDAIDLNPAEQAGAYLAASAQNESQRTLSAAQAEHQRRTSAVNTLIGSIVDKGGGEYNGVEWSISADGKQLIRK